MTKKKKLTFFKNNCRALNYGAIGAILGHELTHGFDPNGRFYDGDGNYRQWWTNETILEYSDRTKCFIDHYNTYYEVEASLVTILQSNWY